MDKLYAAIEEILKAKPLRFVFSAPRPGQPCRRATLRPLAGGWQLEKLTNTQAFHENISAGTLQKKIYALLKSDYFQLTAFDDEYQTALRITKKGKVLTTRGKADPQAEKKDTPATHDRAKSHILPEGKVIPALVDIGVMTQDGKVVAAKRDKWRQINRFVEMVDDLLRPAAPTSLSVVDFGCGKSALTFVLHYYLTQILGAQVHMTGLDLKADVVDACNQAAQKYGCENLTFQAGDIAAHSGEAPDMLVTLHACDTATDLALAKAVNWGTRWIFSVPCCQHELAAQMHSDELALLTHYGIVKERAAALMTDAIRANLLTACGYKTQLLEFIDLEHTPKNIMIRAERKSISLAQRRKAYDEVLRLCDTFGFEPTLLKLLHDHLDKII